MSDLLKIFSFLFFGFSPGIFQAVASNFTPGNLSDSGYELSTPLDVCSAAELCANLPISSIEGIWEYPADEITLLILQDLWKKGIYNVYIIDAVDCRLEPGIKIGEATESPDPTQFRLSLCSSIKRGLPGMPKDCLAKLNKNGESLLISAPKIKVVLSPSIMLPRLWNAIRLSLRMKVENPIERLPEGWRKIYPSYDGNGSSSSKPRYL